MTKKFGVASPQDQMERNSEYFENLQKCYNPLEVDNKADFERSRSSDGILQSVLTEQKTVKNNSSVDKMKMLKRSQTYSVLSMYRKRLDLGELRLASPFARILEKGESFGDPLIEDESNGKVDCQIESKDEQDIYHVQKSDTDSLNKLRGILRTKLTAESVVRSIKFTLEAHDKLGEGKLFHKKPKKNLRSPPPKHSIRGILQQDESSEEDENDDDVNAKDTDQLISKSRQTKIKHLKSKLPLNPGATVHLSNYERYLEEKFNNFEPRVETPIHPSLRSTKSNPSPLPTDVGLSEMERKSIHRRLSVRPNYSR